MEVFQPTKETPIKLSLLILRNAKDSEIIDLFYNQASLISCCFRAVFHEAEVSARNDIFFCLLTPTLRQLVFKQNYCLTKISIRAKRSISRVFSLFIVPSPFFVHCP